MPSQLTSQFRMSTFPTQSPTRSPTEPPSSTTRNPLAQSLLENLTEDLPFYISPMHIDGINQQAGPIVAIHVLATDEGSNRDKLEEALLVDLLTRACHGYDKGSNHFRLAMAVTGSECQAWLMQQLPGQNNKKNETVALPLWGKNDEVATHYQDTRNHEHLGNFLELKGLLTLSREELEAFWRQHSAE